MEIVLKNKTQQIGELISSQAVTLGDDIEYYQIEYTIESQKRNFSRHNIAVCAVLNQVLYTLNVQVPKVILPSLSLSLSKL